MLRILLHKKDGTDDLVKAGSMARFDLNKQQL